jgi:hypothetical protein
MPDPAVTPESEPASSLNWKAASATIAVVAAVFFLCLCLGRFCPRCARGPGELSPRSARDSNGSLAHSAPFGRDQCDHFIAVVESVPETAKKLRATLQQRLDDGDGSSTLDRLKQAASEIEKTPRADDRQDRM